LSRSRRTAPEARRQILEVAEKHLAERGADGVRVQTVAGELGVVPGTVLHHFGSRDGLLDALMEYGAEKLRERVKDLVAAAEPDLVRLSTELFELYESRGYAALYASLPDELRGTEQPDKPVFEPLLKQLYKTRCLTTRRQRTRAAHSVLALNLVAFADALVGSQMRIAVGLPDDEMSRARFFRWLGGLLDKGVDQE
jgi:AcrR family transcriptional regulator